MTLSTRPKEVHFNSNLLFYPRSPSLDSCNCACYPSANSDNSESEESDRSDTKILLPKLKKIHRKPIKEKSLAFSTSLPLSLNRFKEIQAETEPTCIIHCPYSQKTPSSLHSFVTYNTFTTETRTQAVQLRQVTMETNKSGKSPPEIELTTSADHTSDPLTGNDNGNGQNLTTRLMVDDMQKRNSQKRSQFFRSMTNPKVNERPTGTDLVGQAQEVSANHQKTPLQILSPPTASHQHHLGQSMETSTYNESTITDSVIERELYEKKSKLVNSINSLTWPKLRWLKVAILALLVCYTLVSFIFIREKEEKWTSVVAQKDVPAFVDLSHSLDLMFPVWKLRAKAPFLPNEYQNLTDSSVVFTIVQLFDDKIGADKHGGYRVVKGPWAAPVAPRGLSAVINPIEVEHVFKLSRGDAYDHVHRYQLRIDTNSNDSVPITVNMAGFSELSADGIILAAAVLVFLYTLIIFEIVNRTLAAMLGATAAITCLTLIRDRPSLDKVVSWLDCETLCLLFGMMILVAILCETGFFDYVAVVAFRMAKGRTWPLIYTLCLFTGILSAFLDNVTTILLMTPITIRLCEIKNIDPKHVLISLVMFSNIGGAATPVGDPPNVIIISSQKIQQQGIDFGRFTLHMMPGIFFSFIATLVYIRFYFRDLPNEEFDEGTQVDLESATSSRGRRNSNHSEHHLGSRRASGVSEFGGVTKSCYTSFIYEPSSNGADDNSLDYGSNGHTRRNSQVHNNKEKMVESLDHVDTCYNCNNLEEFCMSNPNKNAMFDGRRVVRSPGELQREIEVWKKACNSIPGYSQDENAVRAVLNHKVEVLEGVLLQNCFETLPPEYNYKTVLAELEKKFFIRDRPLLIKSGVVMSLVITLFFMQSIPNLDLSLGWIAILGSILLLVLADRRELESIIARVEFSTLIFFAALFVVMEALAELKFLWWIGRITQDFINSVPEESRLTVAILVFLWISALASSFIDNIPLTTVMVKILEDLAENNEFKIPLTPLIYALAFGACLGGNGTLIGASSNVVCAGVAEQHGYRFTFIDFFKVGFPIMILTVSISTAYLMICHVYWSWDV